MATSSAWVSVTIKCDHEVIKARQVVQCTWESSFGSLLLKYDKLEGETISHVYISKQENFLDPNSVPVTAPVSLCEQFSCNYVCIYLKRDEEVEPPTTQRVASVLMEASRERVLPDLIPVPEGRSLHADQVLYNDIIGEV